MNKDKTTKEGSENEAKSITPQGTGNNSLGKMLHRMEKELKERERETDGEIFGDGRST
jgi:hypothetical protein